MDQERQPEPSRSAECPQYDLAKLAYAAGYFDGEGSINVLSWSSGRQLRVDLQSYDLEALSVFGELFGGVIWYDEFAAVQYRVCRWVKRNEEAISFLRAVAPFLRAKKYEAQLVIDSGWETMGIGQGRLTESQKGKRAALYCALKDAKKRNKRPKRTASAIRKSDAECTT